MANGALSSDNKPAFSLADAVTLYQKHVEQVHRFWNYLWLVSFATITISANERGRALWQYLLAAFIAFAIGNSILIYSGQKEARNAANAISTYLKNNGQSIPSEFKQMLQSVSMWPEWLAFIGHLIMDAVVVIFVYKLAH